MDKNSTMIDEKRTIMHEKITIMVEITHEKSTIFWMKRDHICLVNCGQHLHNGEAIMHIIGLIPGIGGFGTGQKLYPSHTSHDPCPEKGRSSCKFVVPVCGLINSGPNG